jgi:outer membrane immunogenic protein
MRKFAMLLAGVAFSGSGLAAAALAFAGSAHAQMPMPKPTWEGYYIGVNGGGVSGTTNTGMFISNSTIVTSLPPLGAQFAGAWQAGAGNQFNNSGSIFGGQFGKLWQTGALVAGIEVAFDAMKLKGSTTSTDVYPGAGAPNTFTFNESVGADWLLTFMMRAGFDWGAWYPYATGGAAVASLKYTNSFTDMIYCPGGFAGGTMPSCPLAGSFKQVAPGLAFGGGLEWRWGDHWSLRGEFLHIVFADDVTGTTASPSVPPVAPPLTFFGIWNHKASFEENIVRGFISYRFVIV